jgi:hypothetical protein
MPLPEDVRLQAHLLLFAFCQIRVPESIRNEYHLAFRARENAITLYECIGPWQPRLPKSSRRPAAQFRYDTEKRVWSVHWADKNEHWHPYSDAEPSPDLAQLIAEVHVDPQGVFFPS